MIKNNLNEKSNDKSECLQILKKDPTNYDALLKLGLINIKDKNYSYAKEKFKKLIKLKKKNMKLT